jgi:hypothetical protein
MAGQKGSNGASEQCAQACAQSKAGPGVPNWEKRGGAGGHGGLESRRRKSKLPFFILRS